MSESEEASQQPEPEVQPELPEEEMEEVSGGTEGISQRGRVPGKININA